MSDNPRIIVITSADVPREVDSLAQGVAMARRSQGRVYVEVDQAAWPVVQEAPNGWPVGQRSLSDSPSLKIEMRRICPDCGARVTTEWRGDREYYPCCAGYGGVV